MPGKRLSPVALLVVLVCGAVALADTVDDAAALFGQKKYAEAVALLKTEIEARPTHAKAYLFLASSYEKLEKWAEAVDAWDRFVKLAKSDGEREYGETRLTACRARASGKVPDTETEDPEPDATGHARFLKQGMVFVTVRTQHFMVQAKNRALCDEAAKEAERHLGRIMRVFLEGREWPHTITIRIHKNHPEYVIEAGTPQWSGGGYSVRSYDTGQTLRRIDLFALDKDGKYIAELLTKTLPHEMTHVVLHEYFGERTFRGLPLAINEGLAMYVEEGTAVRYERQLADAVKKGVYYKLPELFQMQRYPPNVGLFYAQAASATRYLIENMTAEQFQSFLAQIRKGNDVNSSLQSALGRTGDLLTAMQEHWVDMLKKKADEYAKTPPEKKPTPEKPKPKPVKTVKETTPPKDDTGEEDEEDVIIQVE
ncbi:MAG TPA: CDC27 family protein [Planctomycetota bacterium]|nr:CDC27 family protein [Planctomycetota bacterium]